MSQVDKHVSAEEWRVRYEVVTSGLQLTPDDVKMVNEISDAVARLARAHGMTYTEAMDYVQSAFRVVVASRPLSTTNFVPHNAICGTGEIEI